MHWQRVPIKITIIEGQKWPRVPNHWPAGLCRDTKRGTREGYLCQYYADKVGKVAIGKPIEFECGSLCLGTFWHGKNITRSDES